MLQTLFRSQSATLIFCSSAVATVAHTKSPYKNMTKKTISFGINKQTQNPSQTQATSPNLQSSASRSNAYLPSIHPRATHPFRPDSKLRRRLQQHGRCSLSTLLAPRSTSERPRGTVSLPQLDAPESTRALLCGVFFPDWRWKRHCRNGHGHGARGWQRVQLLAGCWREVVPGHIHLLLNSDHRIVQGNYKAKEWDGLLERALNFLSQSLRGGLFGSLRLHLLSGVNCSPPLDILLPCSPYCCELV
jgi:hypothetical protein